MQRWLAAGLAVGLALAQAAGASEGAPPTDTAREGEISLPDAADTQAQAQRLAAQLQGALQPLCLRPESVAADFTDAIADASAGYDLDAVILALAQLASDEALCAPARAAASDAQNLAQFAQAAASGDDATGALGDAGEGAPFDFGGFAAPGGAGYI